MTAGKLFSQTSLDMELVDVYDHRSTINIFDEMERIKSVLSGSREATFREISSVHAKVIDRIISFLSLLELYKNEEIEILQFESFGNIIIRFK
jgi:chromatin segregation and condensation protein Rec8/ScpA/Scc1 (kleisin family)